MKDIEFPQVTDIHAQLSIDLTMPDGTEHSYTLDSPEDFYNGTALEWMPLCVVMRDQTVYYGWHDGVEETASDEFGLRLRSYVDKSCVICIPISEMLGYTWLPDW